jgi:hypothetical protein
MQADGSQLAQMANLIDARELRVFVAAVFPLTEARAAYARAEQGNLNMEQPVYGLAYGLGFALGTYLGIAIEQHLAFGHQLASIFTRKGQAHQSESTSH